MLKFFVHFEEYFTSQSQIKRSHFGTLQHSKFRITLLLNVALYNNAIVHFFPMYLNVFYSKHQWFFKIEIKVFIMRMNILVLSLDFVFSQFFVLNRGKNVLTYFKRCLNFVILNLFRRYNITC